jgi:transcription-repair coupling factor (superfamily II helicase)
MTMATTYSLQIPGQPTIEISRDELRSLLGDIEGELHRSKVYRIAIATMQKMLGESAEQANFLFKAVGREAISLAFKQFAQNHHKFTNFNQESNTESEASTVSEQTNSNSFGEQSNDLSQCLTSVKSHQQFSVESIDNHPVDYVTNDEVNNASTKTEVLKNMANSSAINTEEKAKDSSSKGWFKPHSKAKQAELDKQLAVEQRLKILSEIGQELKQARLDRGFSLEQLNVYTHVPIHQMQALENGELEALPEDVFIRGFIRVTANALGLNGTKLAASLPAPEPSKTVIPASWYQDKTNAGLGMQLSPVHLYFGYTALVAGAVGGLSMLSQSGTEHRLLNPDNTTPTSPSVTQSNRDKEATAKPGLKSNNRGVSVGAGISAPEALN